MPYASLRDFIARLETSGRLTRVRAPVSPFLEMTEIQTRLLADGGPAVLFENVVREGAAAIAMPVLVNLFGTVERVAWGMDREPHQLREIGETLAFLKQPEPPGGWREALELLPLLKTVMAMKPKTVGSAPCHDIVLTGSEIDLGALPIQVPAQAEIVIEGHVSLDEQGEEGPYGDHTGYYNAVERFPVFRVSAITMRRDPIYLSTFTGRPPDEPSVLGEALNEVFIPLLTQQFPEIVDFWLPPEGCSYRIAIVSMTKAYPGHAKRVMMGVWSFLRQFVYTKFVIVVDDDID